jgi:hypothetical protein
LRGIALKSKVRDFDFEHRLTNKTERPKWVEDRLWPGAHISTSWFTCCAGGTRHRVRSHQLSGSGSIRVYEVQYRRDAVREHLCDIVLDVLKHRRIGTGVDVDVHLASIRHRWAAAFPILWRMKVSEADLELASQSFPRTSSSRSASQSRFPHTRRVP